MSNHYDVPSWAGRAPTGHHLDVTKDDKLIQKLMIDDKKCYLFGRNPHLNDFCIDHGSCSRVHAALVYHKHLNISYLVDLGSTHGTFIGTLKIESHKPTQLQMNSTFHFGASTRYYILRERPMAGSRSSNIMEDIPMNDTGEGALLGLPESQTELDNLTEYNTAHNRRISMLGITDDSNVKKSANKSKRKRRGVTFNDEEIVINPEDVDPNVGRFRNLIQTTVVPTKRMKYDNPIGMPSSSGLHNSNPSTSSGASDNMSKHLLPTSYIPHLYHDLPPSADNDTKLSGSSGGVSHFSTDLDMANMSSKFGLILPNPAPEVAPTQEIHNMQVSAAAQLPMGTGPYGVSPNKSTGAVSDDPNNSDASDEPRKKKYAKEAWPGRKPLLSSF